MNETARLFIQNAYWKNAEMPPQILKGHIWKTLCAIHQSLLNPKMVYIQKVNTKSIIDIDSITDQEWYEVGRRAVEDVLIELRDARIGILGRNNGLVVNEYDRTPSSIIRLTIEDALKIGMRAIVDKRNESNV